MITADNEDFAPFRIHSRPLGHVAYLITSLFTKAEVMREMERVVGRKLREMRLAR